MKKVCIIIYLIYNTSKNERKNKNERYKNRKIAVYRWYLGINKLLEKLDLM